MKYDREEAVPFYNLSAYVQITYFSFARKLC